MIAIGVDPGSKATGIAVIACEGEPIPLPRFWEIIYLETCRGSLWEQVDAVWSVLSAWRDDSATTAVQVPFIAGAKVPSWHNSMASVAKNAAVAYCLAGLAFGVWGQPVLIPAAECRKKGMKLDEERWRELWRYTGKCSQDARDAAQVAIMGAARNAKEAKHEANQ